MPIVQSPNAIYTHQTTGAKLIRRALRLIRAIDPSEGPSASEYTDGLEALNQMLDSWNGERLTIPALGRKEFTLVAGQAAYEIGPGASDFDSSQVVKIEQGDAYLKIDDIERQLAVLTQEEWAAIPLKSNSTIPGAVYYEMNSPLGTINFYSVPDVAYTFILYVRQLLAQIVQKDATFQLLPAYAGAIAFNLAIELAPEYGKTASAEIIAKATEGKAIVKRQNIKPLYLESDPAFAMGEGSNIQFERQAAGFGDTGWDDGGL